MILELRLDRATSSKTHLQRALPAGAFLILVRYTSTQMVALYRI